MKYNKIVQEMTNKCREKSPYFHPFNPLFPLTFGA